MSPRTRLLGVDYGAVRIGLAVSDPDRKISFPLAIYTRVNLAKDAAHFKKVVEDEEIGQFVVGLPIHLSGQESPKSTEARAFGQWLAEITELSVVYFDERFSTVEAESALWATGLTHKQRKERRDKVAAQIMLQGYLEAGCPGDEAAKPV